MISEMIRENDDQWIDVRDCEGTFKKIDLRNPWHFTPKHRGFLRDIQFWDVLGMLTLGQVW